MTLAPIVEGLSVELSLHVPVFMSYVCRDWDSNTQTIRLRGERSNPLRHRRGKYKWFKLKSHLERTLHLL